MWFFITSASLVANVALVGLLLDRGAEVKKLRGKLLNVRATARESRWEHEGY